MPPCSNTVSANHADSPTKATTTSAPMRRMLCLSSFINVTPSQVSLSASRSMSRASSSAFMDEMPSSSPMEKHMLTSDEPP